MLRKRNGYSLIVLVSNDFLICIEGLFFFMEFGLYGIGEIAPCMMLILCGP